MGPQISEANSLNFTSGPLRLLCQMPCDASLALEQQWTICNKFEWVPQGVRPFNHAMREETAPTQTMQGDSFWDATCSAMDATEPRQSCCSSVPAARMMTTCRQVREWGSGQV